MDLVVLGVEAGEEVPGGREEDRKYGFPDKTWSDKPLASKGPPDLP